MSENTAKPVTSLLPACLCAANLFLFVPFAIYHGNIEELAVPFLSLLGIFALPALALVLVFTMIGSLLPQNWNQRYVGLILTLGILLWLQGSILVWDYGVFDGTSFDWSERSWRGWIDTALWFVLLGAGYRFADRISLLAVRASIALIAMQLIPLIVASAQDSTVWSNAYAVPDSPPESVFSFSESQNVIQILLDSFQTDFLVEFLAEEPRLKRDLDGFTFFRENMGNAPKTFLSMTAIMSGRNYKNEMDMRKFQKKVLSGRTIPSVLAGNGHGTDLVVVAGPPKISSTENSSFYRIPKSYGFRDGHRVSVAATVMDLSLFRVLPHFLKKFAYGGQLGLVQSVIGDKGRDQFNFFSHSAFLEDLTDQMTVSRTEPVYKFIHLMTSHVPYVVDEGCEYAGEVLKKTVENARIQCRCALVGVVAFLKKLKNLGLYESSLIIIHADHGNLWVPANARNLGIKLEGGLANSRHLSDGIFFQTIAGNARPLLLVKPPQAHGSLQVSNAQTQLSDIPATVMSVLELKETFPGQSVFRISPDETRERVYYYSEEYWPARYVKDYYRRLDEYVVAGDVLDKSAWRLNSTFFPNSQAAASEN